MSSFPESNRKHMTMLPPHPYGMPLPRRIAVALIGLALLLLALTHYRDGLAAQPSLLLGIMLVLFAGLLLGRTGLWLTAAVYFAILGIGAWSDLKHGVAGFATPGEASSSLLQPAMGCLIVTLILDRMILKSDASQRRSHDLALLCRQLEFEMQEKDRTQAQLIHSQRMDSLGKLASNVAHDFNNLLGVILGYAKLGEYEGGAARSQMAGIVNATQRGKQLTEKLMTLARMNPSERTTFDANESLDGLLPMIQSMLGTRIRVMATFCPQAAWVHMDFSEFEASVLNIAKNAGDAIAGDGAFSIASDIIGDEVRLCFSDSGCGMSPEVAARIFEPFFTTKAARKGTGIGLAVVYRTIVESGGRIAATSTPGQGTCFTLHLPLHDAPQSAAHTSPI